MYVRTDRVPSKNVGPKRNIIHDLTHCQVYVNERLHQRIISASRTKAIVHGIANLEESDGVEIVIGIESRNDAAFDAAAATSDRANIAVSRNILQELDSRKKTPPPVPRKL